MQINLCLFHKGKSDEGTQDLCVHVEKEMRWDTEGVIVCTKF